MAGVIHAQDGADDIELDIESESVTPGSTISGTLDNNTPRNVWFFEGSRGEVVHFQLTVTSGTLDPVLTVFDSHGTLLFRRDDQANTRDLDLTVTLSRDDRYYISVARFGGALGSTQGGYSLLLERVGVLSQQGSTLRYDEPVIDRISSEQPELYYTFRAEEGDILNLEMIRSSGNLDPYLIVVDSNRYQIADNDDYNEQTEIARIANLLIEETGTYVVIATRYGQAGGDTAGNFVLTISESENSGLGNSILAPQRIASGESVEGIINDDQYQRYFTFTANQHDLVTITMDQTSGRLDAYLVLLTAADEVLFENDDGGSGRNARISQYRIPQAGTYTIVATRLDGEAGTSLGGFRLQFRIEGSAFEGVNPGIPRLTYGSSLQDQISDADPDSLFVFWGNAGETITVFMNRSDGDLDPVLELMDSQQQRILRNDDASETTQNARIERYSLPYTGVYYIRAMRYEGEPATSGMYALSLQRVSD
ncbi:PPC domain-containing protein [Phototrophicus methaneseepsis]|uniref:PPC domain-containing protein n=1 Tax=Phototrophicus methaneseepsis TaxID=2710758 RepID=A0A7S8IEP3_9CHLR|nr:PPC domain-containing protein [Phototrophicus methaneseepsis]QPC82782.1 PPC domain-containing protein [Phototrophicus methaneseepsis]